MNYNLFHFNLVNITLRKVDSYARQRCHYVLSQTLPWSSHLQHPCYLEFKLYQQQGSNLMNCDSKHKEKSGSVFGRHDAGVAGLQTDRQGMQGSNNLLQGTISKSPLHV